MARVEVKTKNPDIHITVESGTNKDVVSMVKELYGFIVSGGVQKIPPEIPKLKDSETTEQTEPQTITRPDDSIPGMRRRIPNNVVDPSTLEFTRAVQEDALVRCPHCGQNHVIAVKSGTDIYLMRMNYQKNNYEALVRIDSNDAKALTLVSLHGNDKYSDTDDRYKVYWEDIQKAVPAIEDADFVADNETEVFCPVCGQSDTFRAWKECHCNPLDYFEYDHICSACGGEMSLIQDKEKESSSYKCDKCGWEEGGNKHV